MSSLVNYFKPKKSNSVGPGPPNRVKVAEESHSSQAQRALSDLDTPILEASASFLEQSMLHTGPTPNPNRSATPPRITQIAEMSEPSSFALELNDVNPPLEREHIDMDDRIDNANSQSADRAPETSLPNEKAMEGGEELVEAPQDLEAPDNVIPSVEKATGLTGEIGLEAADTTTNTPLDLSKYQVQYKLPSNQRVKKYDRSSAPPDSLQSIRDEYQLRRNDYLDRFSKEILPPPNAPLALQIMTYVQRWSVWAATIKDPERRELVIDKMSEKMENVWLEGMRRGMIPQSVSTDLEPGPTTDISTMTATQLAATIINNGGHSRTATHKKTNRRGHSPSREVMIDTKAHKGSEKYGITAGELVEAKLLMDRIEKRVANGCQEDGEELLEAELEARGGEIASEHWFGVQGQTSYNPMGRGLKLYCCWEALRSQKELAQLERLKRNFSTTQQVRNTEARISAEQDLYAHLLAIALELDEESDLRSHSSEDEKNRRTEGDTDTYLDEGAAAEFDGQTDAGTDSDDGHEVDDDDAGVYEPASLPAVASRNKSARESLTVEIPVSGSPSITLKRAAVGHDEDGEKGHESKRTKLGDSMQNESITNEPHSDLRMQEEVATQGQAAVIADAHGFARRKLEEDVDDVPGLPDKAFILAHVPSEGLLPKELGRVFGAEAVRSPDWQRLFKSVAFQDRVTERWYIKPPSCIMQFNMGSQKLDPNEYSTRVVNNSRGFRWRYTNYSSLQMRAQMDEQIDRYTLERVRLDSSSQKGAYRGQVNKPKQRYGQLEYLAFPKDPTRTTVVYGVWSLKGGKPVPGLEWFYEGRDGDFAATEVSYKYDEEESRGELPTTQSAQTSSSKKAKPNTIKFKRRGSKLELEKIVPDAQNMMARAKGKEPKNRFKAMARSARHLSVPTPPREPERPSRPKRSTTGRARRQIVRDMVYRHDENGRASDDEYVP